MGNELASRHQGVIEAVEESVFERLTEDADAAREVIQELYWGRERLLRQQTESPLADCNQVGTVLYACGIVEF